MPLPWVVLLLLWSFTTRNQKLSRKLRISALVVLLFFTNSFIADEAMRLWEVRTIDRSELKQSYDYGIVLGGMISYDAKFRRINFLRSTDRLLQAVELYKLGKIKKILITSGSGSIKEPETKEAALLRNYLLTLSIPSGDVIAESESKNTHENAVYTCKLIKKNKYYGSYLLITSASHMRRAQACFKKLGIVATPYVTDRYAGPRKFWPDHLLLPSIKALEVWSILIHEIFGYFTYGLMGYV